MNDYEAIADAILRGNPLTEVPDRGDEALSLAATIIGRVKTTISNANAALDALAPKHPEIARIAKLKMKDIQ